MSRAATNLSLRRNLAVFSLPASVLVVALLLPIGEPAADRPTVNAASPSARAISLKSAASLKSTANVYPLKGSPNGRYLVDQRNVPFMIVGDSPQSLIVNVSLRDAATYLANRRAAGFNAIWVNLLCNRYTAGRSDGSTYDGISPFKKPGDLSTPNSAYFARADAMIRLAAKYGMTVFLDPIETGGWLDVLFKNGIAKDYRYGLYLGKRYKKFPNIVWMSGNDFQKWQNPAFNAAVLAVAKGIRAADPKHLQTLELAYFLSSSLDNSAWRPLLTLNAVYTYYPTYAELLKQYFRRDFLPTFMVEANYEFEHNANDETNPETLRRQEYWTMLSGAAGQFYGNKYTWQFLKGWKTHLDTPGSVQMGYVIKLFAGRAWFRLIPDQQHKVVTAGYGTFSTTGKIGDSDYVTAARTPDGRLVMAYLPSGGVITVDMTKLMGPARGRWFDPSRGTYIKVSGSPIPNAGTKEFKPPGKNGDGDSDWVLVLTAA